MTKYDNFFSVEQPTYKRIGFFERYRAKLDYHLFHTFKCSFEEFLMWCVVGLIVVSSLIYAFFFQDLTTPFQTVMHNLNLKG